MTSVQLLSEGRPYPELLAIITATLAIIAGIGAFVRVTWRELRKLSRVLDAFSGTPAANGIPATKGVFERTDEQDEKLDRVAEVVDRLSVRQEEISLVATKAASDVSAVLGELSTNGGASTKDQAIEAARLAAAASALAAETQVIALRTEAKVLEVIHAVNGKKASEQTIADNVQDLHDDFHDAPLVDTL